MVERSLEARIKALEEECMRLRDIEEIRNLRYTYCRCVNKGQWSDLNDCFAEDCVVDFGGGFEIKGAKDVAQFYSDHLCKMTAMTVIYTHNPEIEVTGNEARGLWEFDNFRVEASTNTASRVGGAYEEEYVKQDGKWKIKSLTTRTHFRQPGEWLDLKV